MVISNWVHGVGLDSRPVGMLIKGDWTRVLVLSIAIASPVAAVAWIAASGSSDPPLVSVEATRHREAIELSMGIDRKLLEESGYWESIEPRKGTPAGYEEYDLKPARSAPLKRK